jgi:hypothetical protein
MGRKFKIVSSSNREVLEGEREKKYASGGNVLSCLDTLTKKEFSGLKGEKLARGGRLTKSHNDFGLVVQWLLSFRGGPEREDHFPKSKRNVETLGALHDPSSRRLRELREDHSRAIGRSVTVGNWAGTLTFFDLRGISRARNPRMLHGLHRCPAAIGVPS